MSTLSKEQKKQKFIDAFASIRDELLQYLVKENMPTDAQEWYKRNLDYNVPGGKLNRGLSVIDTAEILLGRPLDDKEYYKVAILGWSVELLQAFFLVSDDMMDSSITRRGQPCWYRLPQIGSIAINDAFMLESAIYYLFRTHFRDQPYYVDLLELMHETTYQTELGQCVDLITAPEGDVKLDRFSMDKYKVIVRYKTAYYSFYLPVALAILYVSTYPETESGKGVSVKEKEESLRVAKEILLPLGEYFQVQDDYLDCFGTPEQIGKVGTDIVDNKCSWLINVALSIATPAQRQLLDSSYGRKKEEDEGAEARVKSVYEELGLREIYEKYEKESYELVMGMIERIPEEGKPLMRREVYTSFLNKIYKRTK